MAAFLTEWELHKLHNDDMFSTFNIHNINDAALSMNTLMKVRADRCSMSVYSTGITLQDGRFIYNLPSILLASK